MMNVAAQIAQRAVDADVSPAIPEPLPLTPESIVQSARQAQVDNEDPWEAAQGILSLASDADKMQTLLHNIGSEFDEHAPEAAMDARIATARAINFLASKAPKASVFAPGMPETKPTATEINKFNRYLVAVRDPTSILDDAMKGTLTSEALDAVRTVYPQTYSQMQIALADRINNAPQIPYHRKIQLSALLGQDMSGTLNSRLGPMAQSVYGAQAPQQQPQQMKIGQAKALGVAGREARETAAWREAQPTGVAARALGAGAKF